MSRPHYPHRAGISIKLVAVVALSIFASVFLVTIVSYNKSVEYYNRQTNDRMQQIVDQVSYNIGTYIDDLFRLTTAPYSNDAVMAALELKGELTPLQDINRTRTVEDYLKGILILPRKDITTVFILTDKVYYSTRLPQVSLAKADFASMEWYSRAFASREPIFLTVHTETLLNPNRMVFAVTQQLRSTKNLDRVLGVIKVDANFVEIKALCDRVDTGLSGAFFVLGGGGEVLYSRGALAYSEVIGAGPGGETRIGGKDYLVNSATVRQAGWRVVAVNAVSELNQGAQDIRSTSLLMAVAFATLAVILVVLLLRSLFLRPLARLVESMQMAESGDLDVVYAGVRRDEIGYMGQSFNAMISRIRRMMEDNSRLIREVYEAKLLQKQAQIEAFGSQIRPHFLFNTLNMISMFAETGENEKVVSLITQLSRMMRALVAQDKDIPLMKEIGLLESYLSIQSTRFAGRLAFSVRVDESVRDIRLPPLMIQPLVENAVVHGCETQKELCEVVISVQRESGAVVIRVKDTGRGIDADELMRIHQRLEHPGEGGNNDSVGLANVNRRIKLLYGDEWGLGITSRPGEGTEAVIRLPLRPEGNGNDPNTAG